MCPVNSNGPKRRDWETITADISLCPVAKATATAKGAIDWETRTADISQCPVHIPQCGELQHRSKMLKQSPSRNLRGGRGYKVKHVAQMCLMLAVTMWMLYHVRHCYYNKVALEEEGGGSRNGVEVKLGRKGMMMHDGVVEDEEEGIGDEFEQVDDLMEEIEEQELDDKEDIQIEDVVVVESFRNETIRD